MLARQPAVMESKQRRTDEWKLTPYHVGSDVFSFLVLWERLCCSICVSSPQTWTMAILTLDFSHRSRWEQDTIGLWSNNNAVLVGS